MTPIITDKYRITFSNAGDLVCLSVDEQIGDGVDRIEEWERIVNIPLPLPQAHEAWYQINANIDQVETRIEQEVEDARNEQAAKEPSAKPDYPDVWSGS